MNTSLGICHHCGGQTFITRNEKEWVYECLQCSRKEPLPRNKAKFIKGRISYEVPTVRSIGNVGSYRKTLAFDARFRNSATLDYGMR